MRASVPGLLGTPNIADRRGTRQAAKTHRATTAPIHHAHRLQRSIDAVGSRVSASDLDLRADFEDAVVRQLEEPAGAVRAAVEEHEQVLPEWMHARCLAG